MSRASSGPLYLVFTDATPPVGVLRRHGAAGPPGLPHGRGVRRAGPGQPHPAGMAGNSPVYGPGWKSPLVVADGVAGKPGLFLPGRTVYFCPFQPGVKWDDALRLRQGLGERAGGQESGPAGGAVEDAAVLTYTIPMPSDGVTSESGTVLDFAQSTDFRTRLRCRVMRRLRN